MFAANTFLKFVPIPWGAASETIEKAWNWTYSQSIQIRWVTISRLGTQRTIFNLNLIILFLKCHALWFDKLFDFQRMLWAPFIFFIREFLLIEWFLIITLIAFRRPLILIAATVTGGWGWTRSPCFPISFKLIFSVLSLVQSLKVWIYCGPKKPLFRKPAQFQNFKH